MSAPTDLVLAQRRGHTTEMERLLLHPAVSLTGGFATISVLILVTLGLVTGRRVTLQFAALSFATLFFLGLTQLPLPDREMLQTQCPVLGAQPNWIPFYTGAEMLRGLSRHLAHPHWLPFESFSLGPRAVASQLAWRARHPEFFGGWGLPALMNLVLCLPIGALLFPYVSRLRWALFAGLTLSLAVELTQLTGTWGLYPCAYRKFDADDLLMNTLGLVLGFLVARWWRRGGHENRKTQR